MADTQNSNAAAASHNEVFVRLKATAHLQNAGQAGSIIVAGAGVIEEPNGTAEKKNVMVCITSSTQEVQVDRIIKAQVSDLCPIPQGISFEDAASIVYPFITSLEILHRKLGIHPIGNNTKGISMVLILGGESAIANAFIQLLRITMPATPLLVACRAEEDKDSPPKDFEEVVRPFCRRATESGARYSIDASAPDLVQHLRAAVDAYGGGGGGGGSLEVILDATGEAARRPEVMELLGGGGTFVDCSQALSADSDRGASWMGTLGELLESHTLRPPLCNDMFVTTVS